jgi:hypothetical protein
LNEIKINKNEIIRVDGECLKKFIESKITLFPELTVLSKSNFINIALLLAAGESVKIDLDKKKIILKNSIINNNEI